VYHTNVLKLWISSLCRYHKRRHRNKGILGEKWPRRRLKTYTKVCFWCTDKKLKSKWWRHYYVR